MTTIREMLGLGEKKNDGIEAPHTNLPGSYFSDEEVALRAAAQEPSAPVEPEDEEPLSEEEAIQAAAAKLETLDLGEGSWNLIDRALDNISKSTGAGLDDEDARERVVQLANLVKATDNDLEIAVSAIAQSTPVLDRGAAVYSLLYSVLKQCVFYANLDYRQAEGMDTYSDEATVAAFFERYVSSQYVEEALSRVVGDHTLSADDAREKEASDSIRDAQGFEAARDIQLQYLREKYGAEDVEDAVVQSLQDIQLLFDLTCQTWGWDPNRPLPYGNVLEKNGSYTPINDARTALDAQEIKRAAAQKKRREQRTETMAKAQQLAAAMVSASLKRPTVHRK